MPDKTGLDEPKVDETAVDEPASTAFMQVLLLGSKWMSDHYVNYESDTMDSRQVSWLLAINI